MSSITRGRLLLVVFFSLGQAANHLTAHETLLLAAVAAPTAKTKNKGKMWKMTRMHESASNECWNVKLKWTIRLLHCGTKLRWLQPHKGDKEASAEEHRTMANARAHCKSYLVDFVWPLVFYLFEMRISRYFNVILHHLINHFSFFSPSTKTI